MLGDLDYVGEDIGVLVLEDTVGSRLASRRILCTWLKKKLKSQA